jgi:hypothetical protein
MTFNARSGRHDDLVLALAIAVWRAMRPLSGAEGWVEHYRRMSASLNASIEQPQPQFGYNLQQRVDGTVKVIIPQGLTPSTIIGGATGNSYMVQISDGRRVVMMMSDDACAMLLSPFSPQAWREANHEVAESLRRGLKLAGSYP